MLNIRRKKTITADLVQRNWALSSQIVCLYMAAVGTSLLCLGRQLVN